jgi:hypothetical protein
MQRVRALLHAPAQQTFRLEVAAMDDATRERRIAELRVMQFNNPRHLIEEYRRIAGESASNQMPHGVSFSRMIDTIVDHEALAEKSPSTTG